MRLFVIFPCLLAMAWAQPLLKRKLLHNKIKERMFGVNTDCEPCGSTLKGVHTVQPMVMGPMPNAYNVETYNSPPQLYGPSMAAPSAGQIYNSQEYSSGQTTHFMNANSVRTHHFRNDKRPAPVLNYASQDNKQVDDSTDTATYFGESTSKLSSGQMTHHFMNANGVRTHHFRNDKRPAPVLNYANQDNTQVDDPSATATFFGESTSKLWQHVENAHAASRAHKLAIVHGGDVDTFGAVPPVPVAPVWIEGDQYNAYSPLGYTGEVMDNSAAAGAAASAGHSSASAWSQQSGNYGPSNGHGVAFAHASSASWSSNNSG